MRTRSHSPGRTIGRAFSSIRTLLVCHWQPLGPNCSSKMLTTRLRMFDSLQQIASQRNQQQSQWKRATHMHCILSSGRNKSLLHQYKASLPRQQLVIGECQPKSKGTGGQRDKVEFVGAKELWRDNASPFCVRTRLPKPLLKSIRQPGRTSNLRMLHDNGEDSEEVYHNNRRRQS